MRIILAGIATFTITIILACKGAPLIERKNEGASGEVTFRTGYLPIAEETSITDRRNAKFDIRVIKHESANGKRRYDIVVNDRSPNGPVHIVNKDSLHFHFADKMATLSTKNEPIAIPGQHVEQITYTNVPESLLQDIIKTQTMVRIVGDSGSTAGLLTDSAKTAIEKLVEE